MPEKQKINILWYTQDLRTHDQESLFRIIQEDLPFMALYIFDSNLYHEKQWDMRKTGPYRTRFLLETVDDLRQNLEKQNIPFLIRHGKPEDIFRELSGSYEIEKVFCQREWTPEEIETESRIKKVLPLTVWKKSYSQLLINPDSVNRHFEKIPKHFTVFREKLEKNRDFTVREIFVSENLMYDRPVPEAHFNNDKVTLQTLGFDDFAIDLRTAFPFYGGETEAIKRLDSYFFETGKLSRYKETRNGMEGPEYSSKFSPWLANGSLSAVTVYHEVKKYEDLHGSNESTYWLIFELLWRDFFRFVSIEFPDRMFRLNGIGKNRYSFVHDQEAINRWKEGKTESGFVNAHMLELKKTGYMSNRGRQNVSSYFCKTLNQDWRIGAAYFEELLIDYDVHSNYGNWMYVAGVGNDPRNRTFNPEHQAEMYDADKKFRKLWLRN